MKNLNNMNFETPKINTQELKLSKEVFKEFESTKTPEELLIFMKDNINYGLIGKKDNKLYSPKYEGWGEGEQPEQKFQNPKELLESGHGTCWEQTELERIWFSKNNFEFKTFLLMFGRDIGQKNPAHTLLAYKKDEKWYWFENSLDKHNGIHKFENLEDLIEDVKNKLIASARKNEATEEDIKRCELYEYKTPVHSCRDKDDFVSKIIKENE